jgi:hypothetical protein
MPQESSMPQIIAYAIAIADAIVITYATATVVEHCSL